MKSAAKKKKKDKTFCLQCSVPFFLQVLIHSTVQIFSKLKSPLKEEYCRLWAR